MNISPTTMECNSASVNMNNLTVTGTIVGNIPFEANGKWIGTNTDGTYVADAILVNLSIYFTPIRLERDATVTNIGFRTNTGYVGGITTATGIYENNSTLFRPSNRLAFSIANSINTSTPTNQSATISPPLFLTAGFYWLGIRFNTNTTTPSAVPRHKVLGLCSGYSSYNGSTTSGAYTGLFYSSTNADPMPSTFNGVSPLSVAGENMVCCLIKLQ